MKQNDDNLIDWSSFEEAPTKARPVASCGLLKLVSLVIVIAALAGIVFAIVSCTAVLDAFNSNNVVDPSGFGALTFPLMLLAASALSLIPAAFGFQTASNPVSTLASTVLGVLGLVLGLLLFLNGILGASSFLPWLIMSLLALAYLVVTCRVGNEMRCSGRGKARHSKEELWDEKNIW